MRCEEVALLIPTTLDDDGPVAIPVQTHIESCLRCQAELARYRRMLRGLQLLRTQFLEPAPGLLCSRSPRSVRPPSTMRSARCSTSVASRTPVRSAVRSPRPAPPPR